MTRLNTLFNELWNPGTQLITPKVIVQLTPNRQYTTADCPRYGALAGPNCGNPDTPAPIGSLPSSLDPRNFDPPSSLAPAIGPVGSPQEQQQIADILGGKPNAAADILFGPLARGTSVTVVPDPNGGGR